MCLGCLIFKAVEINLTFHILTSEINQRWCDHEQSKLILINEPLPIYNTSCCKSISLGYQRAAFISWLMHSAPLWVEHIEGALLLKRLVLDKVDYQHWIIFRMKKFLFRCCGLWEWMELSSDWFSVCSVLTQYFDSHWEREAPEICFCGVFPPTRRDCFISAGRFQLHTTAYSTVYVC